MDGNSELLNYVFQNSKMGVDTIEQILGIVEDKEMQKQLESQLCEYRKINSDATNKLCECGKEEKDVPTMRKISTYLMINMNTMTDKSASHIAQMLIQGSTMGVIDATKNINKYSDARQDVLDLTDKLLSFEENSIEKLKKFL